MTLIKSVELKLAFNILFFISLKLFISSAFNGTLDEF